MTAAAPTRLPHDHELGAILLAYGEAADRLKHSHEALQREVSRLRDQLAEKNEALARSERLASLGEMAAGVAHEVRNPIAGIALCASILGRDLADMPEQLAIVQRIQDAVRRVECIVGDILTFAGGQPPNPREVNLGELVEEVLQQVPAVRLEGVRIEADPGLSDWWVWCDARQVERAVLNLVLNALEAVGASGGVAVRLHEAGRDGQQVSLAVEDDGPGIKPEVLAKVFDPFFTTKDTGTGLGLAIVHRVAESNGGAVTAENRPGGGARFVLTLPRAEEGAGQRNHRTLTEELWTWRTSA